MSDRTFRARRIGALGGLASAVVLIAGACHSAAPSPRPSPQLPAAPLAEPAVITTTSTTSTTSAAMGPVIDTAAAKPEARVTLTGEWSLRRALEEIGRAGNLSLIVSPEIADKKYRISLINVPASVALQTILQAAGLSLQQNTGIQLSWDPTVVFYQLPVNVDSMSVESIMKRFNVSREMAEIMVHPSRP